MPSNEIIDILPIFTMRLFRVRTPHLSLQLSIILPFMHTFITLSVSIIN